MRAFDIPSDKLLNIALDYGPNLLLAILVLVIGLSVIKSFTQLLDSFMEKKKVDPTLTPFLLNIASWGLKALLVISVASMVGVETTSFIAVIGAAGLAIGLALQGSLANFAGGVLILLFKPFVKGDFIEAQGNSGTVDSIDIFATRLKTGDNKKIILPNGPLAGGTIHNFSASPYRRIQLEIGIGYNDSISKAKEALVEMCNQHPNVVQEPAPPFAAVLSYGDSAINLIVRCWVPTADFWPTFFELNEQIKEALDKNQISIPYPQRDVHIFNQK
jgi:small conductance mechanosensitive channel